MQINKIHNTKIQSGIYNSVNTQQSKCEGEQKNNSIPIKLYSSSLSQNFSGQQTKDIFDCFSEKIINEKDIRDTVEVPRSIFKGYLSFTISSSLTIISSLIKQPKISKSLTILGSLAAIYGTFNFIKPYFKHDLTNNKK